MKIFGIGHSRTGTSSLNEALIELGFKSGHFPLDNTTYLQLKNGNGQLDVLNVLDGLTDSITIPFYKNFDRIYPGSKFILTHREDFDAWFQSFKNKFHGKFFELESHKTFPFIFDLIFGEHCAYQKGKWYQWDKEVIRSIYMQHQVDVKHYFKDRPDDLLIMDVCAGDGWDKLCPFLNVDAPGLKAFPWAHKTVEKHEPKLFPRKKIFL
jgi:hypothetical protein